MKPLSFKDLPEYKEAKQQLDSHYLIWVIVSLVAAFGSLAALAVILL